MQHISVSSLPIRRMKRSICFPICSPPYVFCCRGRITQQIVRVVKLCQLASPGSFDVGRRCLTHSDVTSPVNHAKPHPLADSCCLPPTSILRVSPNEKVKCDFKIIQMAFLLELCHRDSVYALAEMISPCVALWFTLTRYAE